MTDLKQVLDQLASLNPIQCLDFLKEKYFLEEPSNYTLLMRNIETGLGNWRMTKEWLLKDVDLSAGTLPNEVSTFLVFVVPLLFWECLYFGSLETKNQKFPPHLGKSNQEVLQHVRKVLLSSQSTPPLKVDLESGWLERGMNVVQLEGQQADVFQILWVNREKPVPSSEIDRVCGEGSSRVNIVYYLSCV